MVESVHRPIALKSSLFGGILESMCVMDCASYVKVLSPLPRFAFLQVTPTVLFLFVYHIVLQSAGDAVLPSFLPILVDPLQSGSILFST